MAHTGHLGKRIQTGIGIAVSVVGLVAYLYLLGGVVMWLRFTAAQLPADDAIAALDNKRLLVMGIKALAFEVVLVLAILIVAVGAWYVARVITGGIGKSRKTSFTPRPRRQSPEAIGVILLAVGLGVILASFSRHISWLSTISPGIVGGVAGFIWALLDDDDAATDWLTSRWALAGLSAALAIIAVLFISAPAGVAVLVLIVLAFFSNRLNNLSKIEDPRHLIPAALIVGTGLGLVAAAYVATPPVWLDRVTVATASGQPLSGGYVGESHDGMVIATCVADDKDPTVSHSVRLRVLPPSVADRALLGGTPYGFDYGENPSIFDLAKHYIGGSRIGESLPTVTVDPRGTKLVCGLERDFRLARQRLDPQHAIAWERVWLAGAGYVSVSGPEVSRELKKLGDRSAIWVPIRLRNQARADLARTGEVEFIAVLRVQLRDGMSGERTVRVTMPDQGQSS